MGLRKKQTKFIFMLARLIIYAESLGYELTLGRGRVSKAANKADGGHTRSLHMIGLAQDLNLFKDNKYLTKTKDHRILGLYWERMGGTWGGRFKNKDGNHYSLKHNGIK